MAQKSIVKSRDIKPFEKEKDEIELLLERVENLEAEPGELQQYIKQKLDECLENLWKMLVIYGVQKETITIPSEPGKVIKIERGEYTRQAIVSVFDKEKGIEEYATGSWILEHRHEIQEVLRAKLKNKVRKRLQGGKRQ